MPREYTSPYPCCLECAKRVDIITSTPCNRIDELHRSQECEQCIMKQVTCRPMTGEFGLQFRRVVHAFNLLIDHDELHHPNELKAGEERTVLQKLFEWEQGCLTSEVLIRQLRYEVALGRQDAAARFSRELGEFCQRLVGQVGQIGVVLTSLARSGMTHPSVERYIHDTPRLDSIEATMSRQTELLESIFGRLNAVDQSNAVSSPILGEAHSDHDGDDDSRSNAARGGGESDQYEDEIPESPEEPSSCNDLDSSDSDSDSGSDSPRAFGRHFARTKVSAESDG